MYYLLYLGELQKPVQAQQAASTQICDQAPFPPQQFHQYLLYSHLALLLNQCDSQSGISTTGQELARVSQSTGTETSCWCTSQYSLYSASVSAMLLQSG